MSPRPLVRSTVWIMAVLLSSALSSHPSHAQTAKALAPHKPIAPKVAQPFPLPPPVPGSIVGGAWMVDGNFRSSIHLRNGVETYPVTVTPILYLSNGVRYALPNVQLEPAGTAVVDINTALQSLGIAPYATLSGYVEIDYNWPWDPICATIRNLDVTHSLIFNYGFRSTKPIQLPNQPAPGPGTNVVEGMWWKQEANVTGFVTLANTTSQPLSAEVQVSNTQGTSLGQQTVQISPHGMKMVSLDELAWAATTEGGIRINYTGNATDLLINGGLQDPSVGYSAGMPFTTAPAASNASDTTVAELGLMTGTADPMMRFPSGVTFTPYTVLRNVSNNSLKATPTLWWMAGGAAQSFQLSAISLLPYQTQTLNVSALLAAAGLKNFTGSVNLVFAVQGNAGALLMAGGSVDQTNTYVFGMTPHGISESGSKSLSYWSTANGDDTMVSLWNPADEAQDFIFQLTFSGGHYDFPLHLGPRETRTFNISEIGEIPDAEGNIVPAGVHEGGATIMGSSHGHNEHVLLAMDAGTYNVRKATCGAFCQTCNGVTGWSFVDNPLAVALSGQHQQTLYETWNSGSQYNDNSLSSWTTSNGGVATVQTRGNTSPGLVKGVSPGSATISAQAQLADPQYLSYWCENYQWSCPLTDVSPSGSAPGNVKKPGFLQVVSTATVGACNGAGCEAQIQYKVLDVNGTALPIAGMTVQESTSVSSSCGPGDWVDSGTWTTDANGALVGVDHIHVCGTGNCGITVTQTFTVNGYGVVIMSSNGGTTGAKNVITMSIANGVSSCPKVVITP